MASPRSPITDFRNQTYTPDASAPHTKRQGYVWSEPEVPEPEQLDFVSLLTMTVALFGLGTFSLVSLLGIIVGSS